MDSSEKNDLQYVRIKRYDETYFVLCDEYDVAQLLKYKLSLIVNRPIPTIRLYKSNRMLDDDATCHAQQVSNDAILYAVFKKIDSEKEQWEDLSEVSGINFGDPLAATTTTLKIDKTIDKTEDLADKE